MSNRQEKTAYEFTNYKPISVHKKVYDELTAYSDDMDILYNAKNYKNIIANNFLNYCKQQKR